MILVLDKVERRPKVTRGRRKHYEVKAEIHIDDKKKCMDLFAPKRAKPS